MKYINYIKGKGANIVERGIPLTVRRDKKNKRTKQEDIILNRDRCSKICLKYPSLLPQIYKLARFRPQREFRTDIVYYYRSPGTGKSTTISRVLKTICKLYPKIDYYAKMGGWLT